MILRNLKGTKFSTMRLALTLIFCLILLHVQAQYPLLYETDFEQVNDLAGFEFSDPSAWRLLDSLGNQSLDLFGSSDYRARVRSPFNIAVLKEVMVGDFILEVDLKQTGREYGYRDMCLFFGLQNATNFYYVHIATAADANAHNVFIVNDEARRNLSARTTQGVDWGSDWQKVKIERTLSDGVIKVYFNDMDTPIMEARDDHFASGYVGFGSFDDTGRVDNIKLWGEPVEEREGILDSLVSGMSYKRARTHTGSPISFTISRFSMPS